MPDRRMLLTSSTTLIFSKPSVSRRLRPYRFSFRSLLKPREESARADPVSLLLKYPYFLQDPRVGVSTSSNPAPAPPQPPENPDFAASPSRMSKELLPAPQYRMSRVRSQQRLPVCIFISPVNSCRCTAWRTGAGCWTQRVKEEFTAQRRKLCFSKTVL